MNAIVTDVHISSAVAGLRGLGRAGIRALAVAPRRSAAGSWSRYASGHAVAPDVMSDPAGFAETVGRLAADHGDPVVYPGREEAVDALLKSDRRSPGTARLPYPHSGAVDAVRDKRALPGLAGAAGLGAPRTLAAVTAEQLRQTGATLPAVIKPAWPGDLRAGALRSGALAHTRQAVEDLAAALPPSQELLVQEYSRGPQLSLAVVIAPDGLVVERFQHDVLRTWPPTGGGTSLALSARPDEELVARVAAMLAGVGYWGLAQLDLIGGPAGYQVIDVNPRFYVSMPLALACGVNLPAAWHAVAEGRGVAGVREYRLGVAYRWFEADVSVIRHRWRPLRGAHAGALWDAGDPVPGALMAAGAFGRRVQAFFAARLPARARSPDPGRGP